MSAQLGGEDETGGSGGGSAPHLSRLLELIDRAGAPVVLVWGWPGSGKSALVDLLLAERPCRALAPVDLAPAPPGPGERLGDRGLERIVDRIRGAEASYLVSHALPPGLDRDAQGALLAALAAAVPAGKTLVVAAPRRPALGGLGWRSIGPAELALAPREVQGLVAQVSGAPVSAEAAEQLREAADGWYLPIRLAAEAAGAGARSDLPRDGRSLVELPAVAGFLRQRLYGALTRAEGEAVRALVGRHGDRPVPWSRLLAEAADQGTAGGSEHTEHLETLRDALGLLMDEGGGKVRLLRPLALWTALEAGVYDQVVGSGRASGDAEGGRSGSGRSDAANPDAASPHAARAGAGTAEGGLPDGGRAAFGRSRPSGADRTGARGASPGPAPDPRRASETRPGGAEPGLPAETARLRVRLLGQPSAERRRDDGTWEELSWPLRRALKALAFLAHAPDRRASREELVEAIFPEGDAGAIERNFHPTMSHLRKGLKGSGEDSDAGLQPVLYRDGFYSLNPQLAWWIDDRAFLDLVARGRELARGEGAGGGESDADGDRDRAAEAVWSEAWSLYRGPFLEGFYDPWVEDHREQLERQHLRLLQDLGGVSERLGQSRQAMDAYRAVLVEEPLDETVHLALMRLYARQGRRDLVRRQYERLRGLLRGELGVEPLAETSEEYHRLMTEQG